MSVTPGGPTRPHGRIEAGSGESNAPDMSYTARRWCRSDTKSRNAKTKAPESVEDEHAHLDTSATISRAATCHIGQSLERSAATTSTGHHTDSNFIRLSIHFGIHSFDLPSTYHIKHLQLFFTPSCLRGSVGIYYSVFGST